MRRGMTTLAVVLVLQLALALLLFMRRDPLAGVTSVTLLIPPDAVRNADHLVIDAKQPRARRRRAVAVGEATRLELAKKNGAWVLPGAFDAPADGPKVSALLDRLAALKRGLPIATSEAALKRFKVVDADFERRLVLSSGGKTLATVYFGSSPGLRKSDARLSPDKARVFHRYADLRAPDRQRRLAQRRAVTGRCGQAGRNRHRQWRRHRPGERTRAAGADQGL